MRLRKLLLTNFVAAEKEVLQFLKRHAPSLHTLTLGDACLTNKHGEVKACWVTVFKFMQANLHLQRLELLRAFVSDKTYTFTVYEDNRETSHFLASAEYQSDKHEDTLKQRVLKFILRGGDCPLEHLAMQKNWEEIPRDHKIRGDDSWRISYYSLLTRRSESPFASDDDDESDSNDVVGDYDSEDGYDTEDGYGYGTEDGYGTDQSYDT